MNYTNVFHTIDSHTAGNPTRTILSGVPALKGESIEEKMLDMKKNHDWVREVLMYEPRGHEVMSGAILLEPCNPKADVGVIYIETGGYLPMCGHDTIGFCTALIETGRIPAVEPQTSLTLETPAGLVDVDIKVKNGEAQEVKFKNVPAFHLETIRIQTPYAKEFITCDIAYGGNFYGIIRATDVGLTLSPKNSMEILEKAKQLRILINQQHLINHPTKPYISGLTHIEFFEPAHSKEADIRNTVVIPPLGIDRSPCGTGTSAKLATLYKKGEIQLLEPFTHESIVGGTFVGEVINETTVGAQVGVETTIAGTAWVTGMHQFFINPNDPFRRGFLLNQIEDISVQHST